MGSKRIYRVIFVNQGQAYELYAREVGTADLMGFVEVAGLIFGERTQRVIDPAEERLRNEFQGVQRLYVPLHAVIRIDEVEKEGTAKVVALDGKSLPAGGLPAAFMGPGGKPGDG